MVREYIPGTQARRDRLLHEILQKEAAKGDVLVELEYPDGSVSLKPAAWNDEYQMWVTGDGHPVIPRGEGGGAKQLGRGIPIVRAYAPNAAPVSTEAALIARAEEEGEFVPVGEDGQPAIDRGDLKPGHAGNGATAVADGGNVEVVDHVPTYGVEFSLADADRYDPNPVSAQDVELAIDKAESAGEDEGQILRYVAYGAAATLAIVLILLGAIWLMNQIGGSSGGGGTIMNYLTILAMPRGWIRRLAAALPGGDR